MITHLYLISLTWSLVWVFALMTQTFLSTYNPIESSIREESDKKKKSNKKPGWVSSYNFASLFNVPHALKQFGPLVDLWEGKNQGEGVFKYVKHDMCMGLRRGWQKRLLQKLLVRKGLSAAMRNLNDCDEGAYLADMDETEANNSNDEEATTQSMDHHCHMSRLCVLSDIATRKPISCVLLDDGTLGAMFTERDMVELSLDPNSDPNTVNGMVYKNWELHDGLLSFGSQQIVASILLLPLLTGYPPEGLWYTAITSRWKELQHLEDDPSKTLFEIHPHLSPKTQTSPKTGSTTFE